MSGTTNKYLCFRFDVDTHVCLKKGVPPLLKLFEAQESKATFFVNMGRAFKPNDSLVKLRNSLFNRKTSTKKDRFSMIYKLGIYESLVALVYNPVLSKHYQNVLISIAQSGNELGLHGGKNHANWDKGAFQWTQKKILNEIEYGLNAFQINNLPRPISFASPCWKTPRELNIILNQLHFKILADVNSKVDGVTLYDSQISIFPTNILSDNGQVGFIENLRASGYTTNEILDHFSNQLNNQGAFKMVFDHPCYAGVKELDVVESMIKIAKEKGYLITSLCTIYKKFKNENSTYLS